jgi:hypothetical protein
VLSSVEFPIDTLDIGRWLIQVQAWVVLPFKVLLKSVPDRAELVALEQLTCLSSLATDCGRKNGLRAGSYCVVCLRGQGHDYSGNRPKELMSLAGPRYFGKVGSQSGKAAKNGPIRHKPMCGLILPMRHTISIAKKKKNLPKPSVTARLEDHVHRTSQVRISAGRLHDDR